MDTKCVKGIPIKLTLWINLEKLEGKSWDFGNQIEKLDRWQNIKKIEYIWKIGNKYSGIWECLIPNS